MSRFHPLQHFRLPRRFRPPRRFHTSQRTLRFPLRPRSQAFLPLGHGASDANRAAGTAGAADASPRAAAVHAVGRAVIGVAATARQRCRGTDQRERQIAMEERRDAHARKLLCPGTRRNALARWLNEK